MSISTTSGVERVDDPEGAARGTGFADDLVTGGVGEDVANAHSKQGVIIDQDDSHVGQAPEYAVSAGDLYTGNASIVPGTPKISNRPTSYFFSVFAYGVALLGVMCQLMSAAAASHGRSGAEAVRSIRPISRAAFRRPAAQLGGQTAVRRARRQARDDGRLGIGSTATMDVRLYGASPRPSARRRSCSFFSGRLRHRRPHRATHRSTSASSMASSPSGSRSATAISSSRSAPRRSRARGGNGAFVCDLASRSCQ